MTDLITIKQLAETLGVDPGDLSEVFRKWGYAPAATIDGEELFDLQKTIVWISKRKLMYSRGMTYEHTNRGRHTTKD